MAAKISPSKMKNGRTVRYFFGNSCKILISWTAGAISVCEQPVRINLCCTLAGLFLGVTIVARKVSLCRKSPDPFPSSAVLVEIGVKNSRVVEFRLRADDSSVEATRLLEGGCNKKYERDYES